MNTMMIFLIAVATPIVVILILIWAGSKGHDGR